MKKQAAEDEDTEATQEWENQSRKMFQEKGMGSQQKAWHLKCFPACDPLVHAQWKNKGRLQYMASLLVLETRAAPRSWQMTNEVFKQGTKNLKDKQGD